MINRQISCLNTTHFGASIALENVSYCGPKLPVNRLFLMHIRWVLISILSVSIAAFQSFAFIRSPNISTESVLQLNFTHGIGRVLYLAQLAAYAATVSKLGFVTLSNDLVDRDDFGFLFSDDPQEVIDLEEELFLWITDMVILYYSLRARHKYYQTCKQTQLKMKCVFYPNSNYNKYYSYKTTCEYAYTSYNEQKHFLK